VCIQEGVPLIEKTCLGGDDCVGESRALCVLSMFRTSPGWWGEITRNGRSAVMGELKQTVWDVLKGDNGSCRKGRSADRAMIQTWGRGLEGKVQDSNGAVWGGDFLKFFCWKRR